MPEDLLISKLLKDLVVATSSNFTDDEIERQLASTLGSIFGLEKVVIKSPYGSEEEPNELYGHIANTKKIFVDNQLSEYSLFPQLINYRNRGFRSCAVVPIIVSGKVVSIVELLSVSENKFSDALVNSASLGAYFTGIALLYKYENDRSLKLASYFNSAFNGAEPQLLVSSDGKIIKSNDAARRQLFDIKSQNGTVNELLGMDFGQIEALPRKGSTITIEKEGQKRLYRISSNKVNDRLFYVELQEITELYSLSRVMETMDSASRTGVIYLNKELAVTRATKSIKSALGYDENLLIGKTLIELVVEKQRGELKELLESLEKRKTASGSMDFATESGIPSHLNLVLSKLIDGYVVLFTISDTEGYLQSIRSAFTDFINSTSDIVITMDASGYIKECNMSVESVLGYSRSELVGREAKSLYSDQTVFDRDITYVRNGSKIDNSYVTLLGRNGNHVDATHSIRLFRGTESVDYLIVAKELETKRGLTDLKEALDKEKSYVKRLHSTGKLKSQFIYNISHELKTPLTNIKGFAKLMYSGEFGELNKDQLNYLGTIIDEADRLMLIIQQVLDAAKLESEKMTLELREVDLKELGDNPTMQSLRESALNKKLKFSWIVDYDVPKINADMNRLIQVFVNLIGNSIKFTDNGEVKVHIKREGRSYVRCDVADTGIGISEEDQHKLFKKFYEAPKKGLVKQEGAGTGLGLSITKEIVSLHGGKIGCESELDKGSTFSFTLRIRPTLKKKD